MSTETVAVAHDVVDFDYVDLNQVNPEFNQLFPVGVYELKIMKVDQVERQIKNGPNAGTTTKVGNFQFAITNHPEFSGRRLFETFFQGEFALKIFRRLADATGVAHDPGTPLSSWFEKLSAIQPTFKVKVDVVTDYSDYKSKIVKLGPDGKEVKKNRINFFEVSPV